MVYELYECKTYKDYEELYLKTDVLLLADVFENFRKMCKNYYKLDPCHYYTAPGFSWDSMLKLTSVSIECFKQGMEDMLQVIQKGGIRGGISVISTRYAKANNKYMKSYDPKIESSHIAYLDPNNLYGWAMSQYLPYGSYEWDDVEKYTINNIMEMKKDGKKGAIFEVDIETPEELHDYFNDYPLAPESCEGEYSPLMREIMKNFDIKECAKVKKLIPNLNKIFQYVLHYRNLQLYLSLGMKLTKIHRVLTSKQSDYMRQYIEFNTTKRAQCTNDFEKDLFKLFNNSIFGKTCENVENHIDVKLFTDGKKFVKNASKPNFKSFKIFSEGLIACEMGKTVIK